MTTVKRTAFENSQENNNNILTPFNFTTNSIYIIFFLGNLSFFSQELFLLVGEGRRGGKIFIFFFRGYRSWVTIFFWPSCSELKFRGSFLLFSFFFFDFFFLRGSRIAGAIDKSRASRDLNHSAKSRESSISVDRGISSSQTTPFHVCKYFFF